MKKIGMVVAMKNEVLPFIEGTGAKIKYESVGKFNVCIFKLKGKKVFLVESGIGEIFASGATQLLICKYGVEAVINFGVCGSLVEKVGVLDTVLVEGVVHYDFDLSPIDNVKVGMYPGFESEVIPCDKTMLKIAEKYAKNIEKVICASADKFVADEKIKEKLNLTYGAKICEMECAGVALTCIARNVPFLIVKAVSDGKGGAEEFNKMVKTAAKEYVDLIIKMLEAL